MKVPTGLSRIEQETFFRTDGDHQKWEFYSRDPKLKQLLERQGHAVTENHQGLWVATIPFHSLTVRKPNRKITILSDEQRALKRSEFARRLGRNQEKNISERPDEVLPGPEIGA